MWRNPPTVIPYDKRDVRSLLFTRLIREDNEFRKYFSQLAENIMKNLVTENFLSERLEYYTAITHDAGLTDRQKKIFKTTRNF